MSSKAILMVAFGAIAISYGAGGSLDWKGYCSGCKAGFLKWKSCLTQEVKGLILEYGQQCIDADPRLKNCKLDDDDDDSSEEDPPGHGGWPPVRRTTTKKPTTTTKKPTTTTKKPTTKKSNGPGRGKRSLQLFGGKITIGGKSFGTGIFKSGIFGSKGRSDVSWNNGFRFYFGGNKDQHDEFYKCSKGCSNPFTTCFNKEVGNGDFNPEQEVADAQSTSSSNGRRKRGVQYHNSASWCHDKSLSGRIPYSDDDYESQEIFDGLCGNDKVASALLLKCVITKAYPGNDLNPILSVCKALKASNCSKLYDEISDDCKNRANFHRQAYCKCKPPTVNHFNSSNDCSNVRKYAGKNSVNDFRAEKYFALIDDAIAGYIDLPFHPFTGFCNKSLEQICKELTEPPPCTPPPTTAPNGGFSSAGRTFYQVFNPQHPAVDAHSQHIFILSTDAQSCLVSITYNSPNGKQIVNVSLTNTSAVVQTIDVGATVGVLLTAPCDFVVYGLNFNINASADGWLGLPIESLSKEYIVLGIAPINPEPTQLSIVAAQDDTVCTSTFPNGTTHTSSLNSLDVDFIQTDLDLTGTIVSCNANVSVFTGQQTSLWPSTVCLAGDHTVEQIPPKSTFGKNFALVPLLHSCSAKPSCCTDARFCEQCYETYRVLAIENNTQITYTGTATNGSLTLQAGESDYILILQTEVAHLTSSQPILVGTYFPSAGYEGVPNSDPSYSLIPQIESFASSYRAATCFSLFTRHFINVVIPAGTSSQLLLNGATFLNETQALPIPGTDYEGFKYQFDCSATNGQPLSFSLVHTGNKGFGLLAYGFARQISYGYIGGMKLAPVNTPGC